MGWYCSGYGSGWGSMHGFGIPGFFVFILLLALVGYGIYWLIRQSLLPVRQSVYPDSQAQAIHIAQSRLASGEISLTEFEEIRDRILS
jgi:uncharacterized membrane protein